MTLVAVGVVFLGLAILLEGAGFRGLVVLPVAGAGVLFLAGATARVVRLERERRARSRLGPVPPPGMETLIALVEPVHACPRCGSTRVAPVLVAHEGAGITCARCAFVGPGRVFERAQEYAAFVRALPR